MEGCKATFLNDLRESGIYFVHSDGTEHMPVGTEWNIVELTEEQRAERDEFLRVRRALHEGHGQRLGAMSQEQRVAMRRDARH
eukprot:11155762-Lingulodinium_polyedra.AAC.1